MASTISLQTAALRYLDTTGLLDSIKDSCGFYRDVQDKAFQFVLPVCPSDLLDTDVSLGTLLLSQPNAAGKIFQQVVYTTITTLNLLPQCTSYTQIVVIFKLMSLPKLEEFQLVSSRDFLRFSMNRTFIQYKGVVCGRSTVSKYTKIARFVCTLAGCPGSEGDKYIRLHIPGARETQTIRSDFTCTTCSGPLQEDVACRVLADKMVVELIDEEAFSNQQPGQRHQSVVTFLRDDLTREVEIGQTLDVIGRPVLDVSHGSLTLEANSVVRSTTVDDSNVLANLPETIRKLQEDRRDSPWSFPLSLAYVFGGDVAPPGTFLHLKLCLLLSLVTSRENGDQGLDLLAVGSDSLLLHRLLDYAAMFSERRVIHNVSSPLTVTVSRDRHNAGGAFIEGGSILLADKGVCVIHDLGAYKKQVKCSLLQVLDSQHVMVEIPPRLGHQAAQQTFLTRSCNIWAAIDAASQPRRQHLDDMQNHEKGDVTHALADVFSLVLFADVPVDSYADCLSVHQTLLQAAGTDMVRLIPQEDFRQFLTVARSQTVSFSDASEYLLRGYYVASRRVRASGVHMWTLPVTGIKAVSSLAEAHAKLCLRSEVTEQDAVMAILLYEECVTARSGQSVLGVRPLPHIKDNNLQAYIGKERDQQLHQFHEQITRFIKTYATDVDINVVTEE